MNIELKEITIRELTKGYEDNEEGGVIGFDGKLDIRPPYQREFIYKEKQRDAVIDTISKFIFFDSIPYCRSNISTSVK